jgi:hypothetical protein
MGVIDLPFIAKDQCGNTVTLWAPERTGDYATDCAKGREYADAVIAEMQCGENAALLGWIVRGFGPDFDGVEIGFCHRIAEHALS